MAHKILESAAPSVQPEQNAIGRPPLKPSSKSEESYDSFLSALAIPDTFSADCVLQLPPVRALSGAEAEAHMEPAAWLPPTSTAQVQQQQQQQQGTQVAGSDPASTAGQAWDHSTAGLPDMDLNRQRILLAAHERAVDLMQQRQAWQTGQAAGEGPGMVSLQPAGSYPPFPQPSTPQLQERHSPVAFSTREAAEPKTAAAGSRKQRHKQTKGAGPSARALQPSASSPQAPSTSYFGADFMLPPPVPSTGDASDDLSMWADVTVPKADPEGTLAIARAARSPANTGSENEQPHDRVKVRERNRVAQKRYRESQKRKMADTEDQVAELTARLNALATEKATLAARYDLLQKLLAVTRAQPLAPAPRQIAAPVVNAQAAASSWVDGRCLRLLHHVLNVLLRRLGETPGGLTITVCHPILRVTTEQVATMAPQAYTSMCEEYRAAFNRLLAEPRNNDDDPVFLHRASRLVWEAMAFKIMVGTTHPGYSTDIQALDSVDPDSMEEDSYGMITPPVAPSSDIIKVDSSIDVRGLVDQLRFRPGQGTVVAGHRSVFLRNLSILLARRQEACSALQAALAVPGADKQQQVAEAHRRTSDAMLALRATLRDEHYYLLQLRFALYLDVLTPLQGALIYSKTYPASVDVVTMANCVATDVGQPPAVDMLRTSDATAKSSLATIIEH